MRRAVIAIIEVALFSVLIVATRCANYRDVFVGGEIYFTDADCYARMSRVRLCVENPGRIARHHPFENAPAGTTPHTTAPFDYLIAGLSLFTRGSFDLAGAIVSPLLALLTGWFLWWWARRMALPYRAALLLLYALSPILVHGTELGRPDHQSLLLALIAVAIGAEWRLSMGDSENVGTPVRRTQGRLRSLPHWSLVSGAAWGLALWVSFYEPLILLVALVIGQMLTARNAFGRRDRLCGWALCAAIVLISLAIEQRLPVWPGAAISSRWAGTIGELNPVAISDPIWVRWMGLLVLLLPAFLWLALTKTRVLPPFVAVLLLISFALTAWQARWGYFAALIFAMSLPGGLSIIRLRAAGWVLFGISLVPIFQDWDERLWPNEFQTALALERRTDAMAWRTMAHQIDAPFLAPWWLSPAVAYWSGQPGVAGSSHEALSGTEDAARFFLATDPAAAQAIVDQRKVGWIVSYDADRTIANSAALLGVSPTENSLARVLDRTPSQAPRFLELAAQNSGGKLYRVHFFQEK